jgi:hypothetical protein
LRGRIGSQGAGASVSLALGIEQNSAPTAKAWRGQNAREASRLAELRCAETAQKPQPSCDSTALHFESLTVNIATSPRLIPIATQNIRWVSPS